MLYLEQMSLKRLDAFSTSPVSTIPLLQRIYRRKVHQYCFKALTFTAGDTKLNELKRSTLANVNFERLCSYPLGMTSQPYNRCAAAGLFFQQRPKPAIYAKRGGSRVGAAYVWEQ